MAANVPVTTSSKTHTPPQRVCEQGRIGNSSVQQITTVALHSTAVWWDGAGMSTGLCPTFLLIHLSWPVPSHSHQRVASSPPALRQTHCGGCTRTVHRPILLLKRQGSQNKHKIAVRKIQGLKYCSYEGDKNKKLQIRWVPDLYFVRTLCERKLWGKSKTSFMLGVESVWSPCLCH